MLANRSHCAMLAPVAAGLLLATSAMAQSVVYETGFEAADGFNVGNLAGQDAWSVAEGSTGTVTAGTGAGGSARYVQLGANSTVSRAASSGDSAVLIRGSYQGAGSPTPSLPDTPQPVAAVVAFRTIDGNSIAVVAWDGGSNSWTEPAGPVAFSNTAWHEIILALDYDSKTFNVMVNGQTHLEGIGFRDNTVTQLNGIGAGSQTDARIDNVGLFASGPNGDYDGDGWTDKFETAAGNSNPFAGTPSADYVAGDEPSLGDLNGDFLHDAADYALLATAIVDGTASADTADMNGDGIVNVIDVSHYGNRVTGKIDVMR